MACPLVTTGNGFLASALSYIDCQAQTLGSFGFQSLAQPGSPASLALTALLTLFVGLYGLKLLFGPVDEPRDLVAAILKIGIVLTIAVSWPAWRTVAYNTVFSGPSEVAASMMPQTLPQAGFSQRLQGVDTQIAILTASGTGRQTGQIIDQGAASGFRPIALQDESGFAWSRTIYLASTIGSLAALRILGGLLLALAPLMAGLLLFDFTRGIFAGWVRGLVLVAMGALGLTILLSVQVALMEPWLADAVNRRSLGYATPSAPTELLALVAAFAIAAAVMLVVLAKVAFQNAWNVNRPAIARFLDLAARSTRLADSSTSSHAEIPVHSRAAAISESVATLVRREERQDEGYSHIRRLAFAGAVEAATQSPATISHEPLGNSYRRIARRDISSHKQRDKRG